MVELLINRECLNGLDANVKSRPKLELNNGCVWVCDPKCIVAFATIQRITYQPYDKKKYHLKFHDVRFMMDAIPLSRFELTCPKEWKYMANMEVLESLKVRGKL